MRRYHIDQLLEQRDNESRDRSIGAQRQRRELHLDVENDPIGEIDTIIGAHMLEGNQEVLNEIMPGKTGTPLTIYLIHNTSH